MATNEVNRHFRRYDSISEFAASLEEAATQKYFKTYAAALLVSKERTEFTGTSSYDEANALLKFGDKELATKIDASGVREVRVKLKTQRPKRTLYSSVVGCAPNVPAYIAGTPNSMINIRKENQKQRVLNVCYNSSIDCTISTEEIIKASARFIAALMLIESRGVRINAYAAWGSRNKKNGDTSAYLVRIKDARQPFDVYKMAYPMCHPSMLRRHFFRALETTEGLTKGFEDGYGTPIRLRSRMEEAMGNIHARKFQSIVSYYDIDGKSVEQIIDIINKS